MEKIIFLSILLVIVYEFDQVVRMFYVLVTKVSRGRVNWIVKESDYYVGTAVTILTMPLMLYSVMVSDATMVIKLLWLSGIYLVFSIISGGVWYFLRQIKYVSQQQNDAILFSSLAVIGGLFHPALRLVPWHIQKDRFIFAHLAFLLSLPALLGTAFKIYYDNYYIELSQVIDNLIIVMIGGVFINIIVKVIEKHFMQHDFGLFSYLRVIAGLIVVVWFVV